MYKQTLSALELKTFQAQVKDYYKRSGRHDLDWRLPEPSGTFDPYKILVSEMMLQQTQVGRVLIKYREFLAEFPTLDSLAAASLSAVLVRWSGLGYNRRARFLHEAAQKIAREQKGIPGTVEALVRLPGIGPNTAAAVVAYSFNQPVVFIETNIRTVFLHHFFKGQAQVPDTALRTLVEVTLDSSSPREWYWALMDYGSYLKATLPNPSRLSKHFIKQSKFEGSRRQVRGLVLKSLLDTPQSLSELKARVADPRLQEVLDALTGEGLISCAGKTYRLGR